MYKIGLIAFLMLNFTLLSATAILENPYQQKLPMQYSGPTSADLSGDYFDRFMVSFEPQDQDFITQEWTGRLPFPHIGVYGNQGTKYTVAGQVFDYYQWSQPLIVIRLPSNKMEQIIPDSVRAALVRQGYFTNPQKRVQGYIVFSGNPFYAMGGNTTATSPKGYNLAFHSSAYPMYSTGENGNPLVGIFEIEGIQPGDIPVNQLAPRNVFLHQDSSRASSPDNLRYTYTQNKAKFWAVSDYKNSAVVTLHVVLNDDRLEESVRQITRRSNDFVELTSQLASIGLNDEVIVWMTSLYN